MRCNVQRVSSPPDVYYLWQHPNGEWCVGKSGATEYKCGHTCVGQEGAIKLVRALNAYDNVPDATTRPIDWYVPYEHDYTAQAARDLLGTEGENVQAGQDNPESVTAGVSSCGDG